MKNELAVLKIVADADLDLDREGPAKEGLQAIIYFFFLPKFCLKLT